MSADTKGATGYRGREDGMLESTCWCECAVVKVTPAEVLEGITYACYRTRCKPPVALAVAS